MLIYQDNKEGFMRDVENNILVDRIYEQYKIKVGRTSESEIRSWQNSLTHMYIVMNDEDIPNDVGVAIEYNIPNTSKRVDFIVSGRDKYKNNTAVIIELKQWEYAKLVKNKDGIVKTFLGGGERETVHPSYQAWTYKTFIEDFNEDIYKRNINLEACAYLHNYIKKENDDLYAKEYSFYLKEAPAFTKQDINKLKMFIKENVKYGDNKETLYLIENGKIKPSKSLQDSLKNMLNGNKEFTLLDEQKLIYETALEMGLKSYEDNKKRVLIVEGGPGTGKSVIAINLLVDFTSYDLVCQYVTKNSAPREVYSSKLSGSMAKGRISNLFKGSGIYHSKKYNEFDALIVDEAHRLNKKSGLFKHLGENQIKEIIHSSKFSIFFIDETQKVHIDDYGNIEDIIKFAKEENAEYKKLDLESQFRCSGSDGYIAWIDDVLEIRKTANFDGFDSSYDFQVFSNPNDLYDVIYKKNKINNKSRMLAGYCWDWKKEHRNLSEFPDIIIDEFNFGMSWNLGNTNTWAIDKNSINEIGCIHTSQGLEFDYVGVIIGKDLKFRNGKIVTDFNERASTDRSLWGIKKINKNNPKKAENIADTIIKNTYKTLLTRGQKGCYIYCEDKELENYFKRRLSIVNNYKENDILVAEKGSKYK